MRFLEALPAKDPWRAYRQQYLSAHREFLKAYWQQCLGLDARAWRERVGLVRPTDYGHLKALLHDRDPRALTEHALARCQALLPVDPEPTVYLMVGFFSPDGYVIRVRNRWVIGIGLERFRHFHLLHLVVAHEYCHYARRMAGWHQQTLAEKLVSEGLSVAFTRQAFPRRPLSDHLFVNRARLNWLQEVEASLWEQVRPYLSETDPAVVSCFLYRGDAGLETPPRFGVYLGYRAVQALLRRGLTLPEAVRLPAGEILGTGQGMAAVNL